MPAGIRDDLVADPQALDRDLAAMGADPRALHEADDRGGGRARERDGGGVDELCVHSGRGRADVIDRDAGYALLPRSW